MGDVLVNLLPVIVGAAVVPLYPIIVLLLLQSRGGLSKALAFISGGLMMRLVQGVIFGLLLGEAMDANGDDGQALITSTLLLVVGVLLLVTAVRKWRKEEDPDDPPPQWMTGISTLSSWRALGAGALFVTIAVKQWVFTLSAISIIGEAELGATTGIGLYLFYTLTTQLLVLPPVLAFILAPERSAKPLQAAQGWLERNNRVIVMTVSLIFGLWFSYKGITGLIG
ncbi:MAG: GAP family protein [Ardenticatenaceae bacterium]|nr:GAP family protein [Ardenticatenaceae bacterium]MCB8988420.1 GAP family protein [Ardenticatenaceae bacterium]